jgi:SecD/SecF fusion protein
VVMILPLKAEEPAEEEVQDAEPQQDLTPEEESLLDILGGDSDDPSLEMSPDQLLIDYPLFSILNPSTGPDGQLMGGSVIGLAEYSDTARVNQLLNIPQVRQLFPRNVRFFMGS